MVHTKGHPDSRHKGKWNIRRVDSDKRPLETVYTCPKCHQTSSHLSSSGEPAYILSCPHCGNRYN